MTRIEVRYLEGDRLTATVRGHEVTVDQPIADGGEDLAPNPTELFVAGWRRASGSTRSGICAGTTSIRRGWSSTASSTTAETVHRG